MYVTLILFIDLVPCDLSKPLCSRSSLVGYKASSLHTIAASANKDHSRVPFSSLGLSYLLLPLLCGESLQHSANLEGKNRVLVLFQISGGKLSPTVKDTEDVSALGFDGCGYQVEEVHSSFPELPS